MMEEQILAFVELMGGRGNEELLRPLCQAAEREMAGRLREGLSPEACGPAFPVAAAWLVLAGLEAGTDGVTSFSAGDLTVHTGGDGGGAMRRQAERLMAPIWRTDLPFGGCWGESGHHFRPAGPVWAVCDALPRRRGGGKRGAGLPPAPAGGGEGTRPAPPPWGCGGRTGI